MCSWCCLCCPMAAAPAREGHVACYCIRRWLRRGRGSARVGEDALSRLTGLELEAWTRSIRERGRRTRVEGRKGEMAAQGVYSIPPTTSTRTGWLARCPCTLAHTFPRSRSLGASPPVLADEGHATFRRRRVKAAPDPNQPAQGRISDSDDAQLRQHCPQRRRPVAIYCTA